VSSTTDATPNWARALISELNDSDRCAAALGAGLSADQMNWQPSPDAWSIGQCLEHLHIANEVYLPTIAGALDGQERRAVNQIELGWFSRWFIRNYIAPNPNGPRARAPRKIRPAKRVEPEILAAFLGGNQTARELVMRASVYDVNRIRFKNPFVALLRFTVGAGLEIVVKHQSRHLLQAEGVRRSADFPAGN
jgi:hypothetical protein